jgi:hypothetical protein
VAKKIVEITLHKFARLHRLSGDVIRHDIVLGAVRPTLVATHSGADLLASDIVFDNLGA